MRIIENHIMTMNEAHEAIEEAKEFYSNPPKLIGLQRATGEAIKAQMEAKRLDIAVIYQTESALQKIGSEIVDFGVLLPPVKLKEYHELIINSFLKDHAAISDWLYYFTRMKERYRDSEALQRAERHYIEAKELRLQAEKVAVREKIRLYRYKVGDSLP
ncbi:MAG: hypothetical protein HYX85_01970 [Chloroflexi bacterium]|nr:hypothetical protein [Chloroflexota bacterium]